MLNSGTGGGTPKKVRAVDDVIDGIKRLNRELGITDKLSTSVGAALSRASGKKASGPGSSMSYGESTSAPTASTGSMTFSGANNTAGAKNSGFVDDNKRGFKSPEGFVDEPGSGSMKYAAAFAQAGKVALTAAAQAIKPSDYLENDMARRRFGFYAGVSSNTPMGYTRTNAGTQYGGDQIQHMMNSGTSISSMDAAQAAMLGNSNGLMSGLKNYNTVANSAATVSNLLPGVGLQGGFQANIALQQAANVNKLRMIGIQVRDAKGYPRSVDAVANDLWNLINSQKTGSSPLTAEDISLSLLPGNSLAMMMDQYFGNDAVLRQAVITALYQKASGKGFSKHELQQTGALPSSAASGAARNAKGYNYINKYTTSGVQGVEQGNAVLGAAADAFAGAVAQFGGAVQMMTAAQTLAGGGNGAGGTIMGGIVSGFSGAAGLFGLNKLAPKLAKGGGKLFGNAFRALTKFGGTVAAEAGTVGADVAAVAPEVATVGAEVLSALNPENIATGDSSPWGQIMGSLGGGVGGENSPASGNSAEYNPLQGTLRVPRDGEFWNQAPWRKQPHRGTDFGASTGTPVFAIKDGEVVKSGTEGDLGTMIRIKHDDGFNTVYGHLSTGLVSGGKVKAGQQIGFSGYSGGVYPKGPAGAHLHVALEESSNPSKVFNVMPYLQDGAHPTGNASGVYSGASASSSSSSSGPKHLFNTTTHSLFGNGGGDSSPHYTPPASGSSYGNVTVHINVSGANMDEHKLAREVKRVLEDDARMKMAVSR
jgi:murein DD-endopeptidase MepM/ murein hydrolase activator NlpD